LVEYTPSHFGLCVTDLQRSLRFYCDGLGFETDSELLVGDEFRNALEVEGEADLDAVYLRKGPMTVELLAYRSPIPFGRPSASRGQRGLTHMAFYAEDLDEAVAHLVACGGHAVEATRTRSEAMAVQLMFVEDPDGVRVEILQTLG
jgi:lactoylglutathione lyase